MTLLWITHVNMAHLQQYKLEIHGAFVSSHVVVRAPIFASVGWQQSVDRTVWTLCAEGVLLAKTSMANVNHDSVEVRLILDKGNASDADRHAESPIAQ
jgi:hypothetical protein